jgi:hypothetical protein
MPRSLVSQAGPLAMRRVLVADATYLKRSLSFGIPLDPDFCLLSSEKYFFTRELFVIKSKVGMLHYRVKDSFHQESSYTSKTF